MRQRQFVLRDKNITLLMLVMTIVTDMITPHQDDRTRCSLHELGTAGGGVTSVN